MTSETDILDFLRARFGRVDAALAEIKADIGELRSRVGLLERAVAEHSMRMDRIGGDVDHIKRRLDLVDAS